MKFSKKMVLFVVLSIFSLSTFASPHGGKGGSERREKNSRSASEKSGSSRKSPTKDSPSKKFSLKEKAPPKSSSSKPKDSSLQKNKNDSAPPPSRDKNESWKEKIPSEKKNSDKKKSAPEIINYRGNRILFRNDEFVLQSVKSERLNKNLVSLELTFNQSVNPRTFTSDSIMVDGGEIPSKTKFSFNKKGDTIKVSIPSENENFNLTIQNVESFSGTLLEPIQIDVKNKP